MSVRHWRGAVAYWGLAECKKYQWSTLEWLRERAGQARAFASAEDFAQDVAHRLNSAISGMTFCGELDAGIGLHFTAYEYIGGYWIPELFRISNYEDSFCQSLFRDGIHTTRETYNVIMEVPARPEHREPQYRLCVHEYLRQPGSMLIYNNGDPLMFNPISEAILQSIREVAKRGDLVSPTDIATYRAIARMPIEVVSNIQRHFAREGTRRVGGKPHDLAITPNGEYFPDSGDA
jgi:hypothetical protein